MSPSPPLSHPAPALAGLALAMGLSTFSISSATTGLPALADALTAPLASVQWVVLAYLLAVTALVVSTGRLADLLGARRVLLGGIALFSGASMLCALAPTLWTLVAARALQGAGASAMMALGLVLVSDCLPPDHRGRAIGMLGTLSAVGTALGPAAGGVLISLLGWRALFALPVPLALLAGGLILAGLPDRKPPAEPPPPPLDRIGTLLLAATLGAYALAMTFGRQGVTPLTLGLLVATGGGAVLFRAQQRRTLSPLLRLDLLHTPAVRTGTLLSLLVSVVVMTALVAGPFVLPGAFDLPPGTVGLVVAVGPITTALAGLPAGLAVDRFGPRTIIRIGLLGLLAGTGLLSVLPASAGAVGYALCLAVLTGGYALFQAANSTGTMAASPPDHRGVISALLTLSRNLGLTTGAALPGLILSGSLLSAPSALAGLHATFRVTAAVVGIGLVLALLHRGPENARPRP